MKKKEANQTQHTDLQSRINDFQMRQIPEFVEEKRSEYQSLQDKFEKTCITMSVVNKIKNDLGGRFIQRTTNGWKEVDDSVAREKVSHTFRTKTNKSKTNSRIQSQTKTATTDVVESSTIRSGNQKKRIRLHQERTTIKEDDQDPSNWDSYFPI